MPARPAVIAVLLPTAAAAVGGSLLTLSALDNGKVVLPSRILGIDLGDAVINALQPQLRALLGPEARAAHDAGTLRLRTELTTHASATIRLSGLGASDRARFRALGAANPLRGALSRLFCPQPNDDSGCAHCCVGLGGSACEINVPIDVTPTNPTTLTLGFEVDYTGSGALFIFDDADAFATSLTCRLSPALDGGASTELVRSLAPRTTATIAWEMDRADGAISAQVDYFASLVSRVLLKRELEANLAISPPPPIVPPPRPPSPPPPIPPPNVPPTRPPSPPMAPPGAPPPRRPPASPPGLPAPPAQPPLADAAGPTPERAKPRAGMRSSDIVVLGIAGALVGALLMLSVMWTRTARKVARDSRVSAEMSGGEPETPPMAYPLWLIALSLADLAGDILFCRLLYQDRSLVATAPLHLGGRALIALVLFVAPFGLSAIPLTLALRSKENVDSARFAQHVALYSALIFLALSNLDLLQLVPWRDATRCGFPSTLLLLLSSATLLIEDLPQLGFQIAVLMGDTGAHPPELLMAIALSALCIATRVIRLCTLGYADQNRAARATTAHSLDSPGSPRFVGSGVGESKQPRPTWGWGGRETSSSTASTVDVQIVGV